jgi:3-methyladenine DNA glycosylase AlkC
MVSIDKLLERVQKTQRGFTDIQKAADEVVEENNSKMSLQIAKKLFATDVHQARMLAAFIFGRLAASSKESLKFLKLKVAKDPDWRVQEILAQAFNRYCTDRGYEQSLPSIKEWLSDPSPNVRRAVTEGLRIWTSRPYFREHPQNAILFLSRLKNDSSDYVRRSVGNALRDISRKHKDLVREELAHWDRADPYIDQTYKLASKFSS